MLRDPSFWKELSKFVATGLIAFAASTVYTGWKTSPEQNITLVPLSVVLPAPKKPSDLYCHVDKENLDKVSMSDAVSSVSGLSAYLNFLRDNTSEFQTVNVELPSAKKYNILMTKDPKVFVKCGKGEDYYGIPDTRFNVGFLVGQQVTYLLNKECTIRIGSLSVPARIRTSNPSNPYPVEKTSLLEVGYDDTIDKQQDKEAIKELERKLQPGDNDPTSIGITCSAAQPTPWWQHNPANATLISSDKDYRVKVIHSR